MTLLSEIASIQTGPFGSQLHKRDYVANGRPIVTVEHLGERAFTRQNLPLVSDFDADRLKKYQMKCGDIIFSRVGSVDRCSFAEQDNEGWLFSGRCLRIRPEKTISPEFLYYYLSSKAIKNFVRNIAVGATMPSINTSLMGEIPVPDIPLNKQRSIACIMSSLDHKIQANTKINGYLLELAMTRFESALEAKSKTVKFGDIVALEDSKRIPLNSRDREARKGPYPYYGATSVMDYVDDYLFDEVRVLLGEDGTVIDSEGKPILQYVWGKYWVNNHAHILAPSGDYSLEAIYVALRRTAINHIVTGAVQMKISQRNLKSLELEMPSPESLDFLQDLFTVYRCNQDESAKLASLRDALLPKLMSGEIDVSKVDLTQLNSHLAEY